MKPKSECFFLLTRSLGRWLIVPQRNISVALDRQKSTIDLEHEELSDAVEALMALEVFFDNNFEDSRPAKSRKKKPKKEKPVIDLDWL